LRVLCNMCCLCLHSCVSRLRMALEGQKTCFIFLSFCTSSLVIINCILHASTWMITTQCALRDVAVMLHHHQNSSSGVYLLLYGLLQLYGMSDSLLRKVQSIQNATAHLVTGARRCDHIMPVLHQLHWLLVHQRVEYKVAYLVHQSLAGQTPAYVADDIQLVTDSDRHQLR